jgi:hypothetical protein
MDEHRTRRRAAVLVIALVAGAATIATSPAHVESHLDRSKIANVKLDAASPRAVGRFVLTLSAESLPVQTRAGPTPSGVVTFNVNRVGGTGTGAAGPVEITASAVGIPQPPKMVSGEPSWPIEQLCRVAEPCRREFDVSIEWLQPQDGTTVTIPLQAGLSMRYENWEALPNGADATWEDGGFAAAAPVPDLAARADLGSVTLRRDLPFAARHVQLTASAAVLADPAHVDVTAFMQAAVPGPLLPVRAIVVLVPDGSTERDGVGAGTFLQPFIGCARAVSCTRGFSIIARWAGLKLDDQVDLDWSFEAHARFAGATALPDGVTMAAEIDHRLELGLESPRLQGAAKGSFDLQPGGGDRRVGHVRLIVLSPAIREPFYGTDPPAVAVVRLHATVKDPSEPAKLRGWVSAGNRAGVDAIALPDDGSEVQLVAFPLARCPAAARCDGNLEVTVESPANREATISWDIAIELPVPRAQPATDQLRIEVASGP